MNAALPFGLPLGFNDWLPVTQAATLALLTFVQEDVPTVSAALLAAAGNLTWQAGFLGVFLGIWMGDALLYLLARSVGRPLLQRPWALRFINPNVLRFVLKERDCSLHPPGESRTAPNETHPSAPGPSGGGASATE